MINDKTHKLNVFIYFSLHYHNSLNQHLKNMAISSVMYFSLLQVFLCVLGFSFEKLNSLLSISHNIDRVLLFLLVKRKSLICWEHMHYYNSFHKAEVVDLEAFHAYKIKLILHFFYHLNYTKFSYFQSFDHLISLLEYILSSSFFTH